MKTTSLFVLLSVAVAASACDDEKTDPCPQITATGAEITVLVAPGSAPVASGGALAAGTYNLTKLELLLVPGIGADAKVQCEAIADTTRRQTLRIEPTSPTAGSIVEVAIGDEGNGVRTEIRSRASYVSVGTGLDMTVLGTVCQTSFVPKVDGGIDEELELSQPDSMLSRPYSSTESSLAFYAPISFSDKPDCTLVSSYTKQ